MAILWKICKQKAKKMSQDDCSYSWEELEDSGVFQCTTIKALSIYIVYGQQ